MVINLLNNKKISGKQKLNSWSRLVERYQSHSKIDPFAFANSTSSSDCLLDAA